MVERIKTIMAHYQLRAAQFSDAIGMQRSAVSHVLSGRNKTSLDFVLRIKKHFPEISLDWLTLGEGNMLTSGVSLSSSVSQSLFPEGPTTGSVAVDVIGSEDRAAASQNTKSLAAEPEVKDEDMAQYGMHKPDSHITLILFVYDDGTFSEFKPRK